MQFPFQYATPPFQSATPPFQYATPPFPYAQYAQYDKKYVKYGHLFFLIPNMKNNLKYASQNGRYRCGKARFEILFLIQNMQSMLRLFIFSVPRVRLTGRRSAAAVDRQIASLTGQCRQVYCLVEMVPSAPSWRPPHQRGEFYGFQGRREGPNQYRHTRSFQAFSTYPVLRRSRRRSIAPSDPSLNQPSQQSPAACPELPNSSRTFTNRNNSLNREPNE